MSGRYAWNLNFTYMKDVLVPESAFTVVLLEDQTIRVITHGEEDSIKVALFTAFENDDRAKRVLTSVFEFLIEQGMLKII